MRPQILLLVVIAIATAIYPFIVYTGLNQLGPVVLSLALFVLLLARVILRGDFRKPEQSIQLLLVGSLCLIASLLESEALLRYYPVLMSVGFSFFFAISLRAENSLIERFASIVKKDIEPHQRLYMRGLTKVWVALLLVNAVVAAYSACCVSLKLWALYNGVIIYVVFGVFSFCEVVYRYFYRKRYLKQQVDSSL
jgi:uncharacterized membrane protein